MSESRASATPIAGADYYQLGIAALAIAAVSLHVLMRYLWQWDDWLQRSDRVRRWFKLPL